MTSILITGFVGLLGVLIGALAQHALNFRTEKLRFERDSRNRAYGKYLEGLGRLSFVTEDNNAHLAVHAIIAEARGQIALFGSDQVVMCMNRVFQHGDDLYSINARDDVKNLISAMREDSLGTVTLNMETELFLLMYGDGPGGNKEK